MPNSSRLITSGARSLARAPSSTAPRTSVASVSSISRRRTRAAFSTALLPRTRSSRVTAGRWAVSTRTDSSTAVRNRSYAVLPGSPTTAASIAVLSPSSASSRAADSSCSLLATWW